MVNFWMIENLLFDRSMLVLVSNQGTIVLRYGLFKNNLKVVEKAEFTTDSQLEYINMVSEAIFFVFDSIADSNHGFLSGGLQFLTLEILLLLIFCH